MFALLALSEEQPGMASFSLACGLGGNSDRRSFKGPFSL